ncbi:MAG: DNA-binding protein [Thaumarchaeota archaeon]|nr:DNA-binding protein [Nitrososphaerota archaeon]
MGSEEERRKALEREGILRMAMTPEARLRLNNVKMVRPEVAKMVEDQIIALYSSGRLNRVITDQDMRRILLEVSRRRRGPRIRWA